MNGENLVLTTSDGARLDALWCRPSKRNGFAAMVFHGNGNTLDSMAPAGEFY